MTEVEQLRARVAELEHHIAEINRELKDHAQRWPFNLSPTPALMLGVFAKYKNTVLSKELIWRHLYGMKVEADQPTLKGIDVYICKIRGHLRKYGIHIQTMYGTGYLIDEANHTKLMALTKIPFGVKPEVFRAFWDNL